MKKLIKNRFIIYFIIFFAVVIFLTATFNTFSPFYRSVILLPISYSGYFVLKTFSLPVSFAGPVGYPGQYEYRLPNVILEITFGCTGIFSYFILLAGLFAYPCRFKYKTAGFLFFTISFFVYSIVRLIIIGITGHSFPDYLNFVHSYLMEIVNIAFILLVFILWLKYVEKK